MKKLVILLCCFASGLAFATSSEVDANYVCVDQYQKGYAFNSFTRRAWQIQGSYARTGVEVFIYPEDFEIYRCPGCFSFKGFYEYKNENRQVYAFTHMNILHHEMWMFYLTQGQNGETLQATIPCREVL